MSPTRAPSRRPLARDDAFARDDALADIALDAFRGGRARVVVVATRVEVCLVTRRLASIHIHAALGWESVRPVDVVGLGAAVGRARVGRSRGRWPARRLGRGEFVRSLLRPRAFALQVFVPGVYAALRVLLVTRDASARLMCFGLRVGEFHDGSVAGTIGEKTDENGGRRRAWRIRLKVNAPKELTVVDATIIHVVQYIVIVLNLCRSGGGRFHASPIGDFALRSRQHRSNVVLHGAPPRRSHRAVREKRKFTQRASAQAIARSSDVP